MATPWKLPVARHHTKDLGDLGVLKAQLDLFLKGYVVSVPLTEHAPFDLLVSKGGLTKTVQVKARGLSRSGTLDVRFRSTWNDRRGTHYRPIPKALVDVLCIYCPEEDCCYYLAPRDFGNSIRLRVRAPKNGQTKRVRFADDYREVP